MKTIKITAVAFCILAIFSCKKADNKSTENSARNTETQNEKLTEKEVTYTYDGKNFKSFVVYSGDSVTKKPVVFIIPEWWGLNDYAKSRAKQLAEMGYFAMALDFYGDGKTVENPDDAGKLATPFYENLALGKNAFDAGKDELAKFQNADLSKIAVIGYCFGGAQSLNMARQESDLKGAAVFHGNLMTGVKPNNNKVKIIVFNGEADSFIPKEEIAAFKKEMDSAKMDYRFFNYPGALHAFTNPEATELGKKFDMKIAYNKDADEKSWAELQKFLKEIFK